MYMWSPVARVMTERHENKFSNLACVTTYVPFDKIRATHSLINPKLLIRKDIIFLLFLFSFLDI
jgi:hypothetical protein